MHCKGTQGVKKNQKQIIVTFNATPIRPIDHLVQVLLEVGHGGRPIEVDVFDDVTDDAVDDGFAKRRHDFDDEDLAQRQVFFLNFGRQFLRTRATAVAIL